MSAPDRARGHRAWPVTLRGLGPHGQVTLRPLRRGDVDAWMALRLENSSWLGEWEATAPSPPRGPAPTFASYVRGLSGQARAGTTLPFAIEVEGQLVGQLTASSITYGSLCSATIGYWVAERVAGQGIVPTAVALATDHCFAVRGLHRVEVNIRPENGPSLRVAEKLGLREEGLRKRYLHINGRWCDHRSFALTSDEVPGGLLQRWQASWAASP
jgi:ribosomal-protein-alanine N-acetyltransferase